MALADPQSIKISGTTISLPRTDVEGTLSKYTSEDALTQLTVANQETGKRLRQTIRVDAKKILASVLTPSQNEEASMSCYIVFDRPMSGYSNTEALAILTGLNELGSATENKVFKALLARQS